MKKTFITKWVLGSLSALAITSQATTFQYNNGDLLIGLRLEAGGTHDLVIDAGPIAGYTSLPIGTVTNITSLAGSYLNTAFGQTNGLAWSGFACFNASAPANADTFFMTKPRSIYLNQTTPWQQNNASSQDYVVSKIDNVGTGANIIGSSIAGDPINTATALQEPENDSISPKTSYYTMVKTQPVAQDPITGIIFANWQSTFQGDPEQYTDTLPARADFYELIPGSGNSTYIGYFEFSTNGALALHIGPSPIQSTITKIQRTSTATTVWFSVGVTGTYTLLASDDLTVPLSSWTQVGSPVIGNNVSQVTNSISETISDAHRFYTIQTQ